MTKADELYAIGKDLFEKYEYGQAESYLKEAAEMGHAQAQFMYGRLLQYGWGNEENEEKAVYWYQKAVENGDANAQYILGTCYAMGDCGLEEDKTKADTYYLLAAKQGLSSAQYFLASSYYYGDAGEVKLAEALYWAKKAKENGFSNEMQARQLQELLEEIIDEINSSDETVEKIEEQYSTLDKPIQVEEVAIEKTTEEETFNINEELENVFESLGYVKPYPTNPDFNLKHANLDEDFFLELSVQLDIIEDVQVPEEKLSELETIGNITRYVHDIIEKENAVPLFQENSEFEGYRYVGGYKLDMSPVMMSDELRVAVIGMAGSGKTTFLEALKSATNYQEKVEFEAPTISIQVNDTKVTFIEVDTKTITKRHINELVKSDLEDFDVLINVFKINSYIIINSPDTYYPMLHYMYYLDYKNIHCIASIQSLKNKSVNIDDLEMDMEDMRDNFFEIGIDADNIPFMHIDSLLECQHQENDGDTISDVIKVIGDFINDKD